MVALSGFEIVTLVFVVFVAVVVVGLLLYLLRRLKSRREKLLHDLDSRPALSQDRAFNRLAMARREAEILSGQGVDVRHAQELIAESQGAFDTRHFDRSYEVAQSAHEALVTARRQGARTTNPPLPSSSSGPRPGLEALGAAPASLASAASTAAEPPRPTIPKNRAESQFQIELLTEELSAKSAAKAKDPSVAQAAELKGEASEAFDKGEFTDAFRLALRGRRALGGNVESLPSQGSSGARPAPAVGAGNGTGTATDLTQTVETVAEGERCPECGYPTLPGDAFCRGCGRPYAGMTCPSCGAPRGADESFCGRCGTRFP